jgi:hypothetical protein
MHKVIALFFAVSMLAGCGVNNLPSNDEEVTSAWSHV